MSFYTRSDLAYYAINDRSAGKEVIVLDLMTEAQHNTCLRTKTSPRPTG